MIESKRGLAALAIALGCASIAAIFAFGETPDARARPEAPAADHNAHVDTTTTTRAEPVTRSPVEGEHVGVPVDLDPASWEAAFPLELRPALREHAKRPNAALILVDVRGFSRGLFQKDIDYIAATVLCKVPELGYEPGQVFDAWVATESPLEPAVSDDLRIGERRVLLIERVLWKTLIRCVSAPVSVNAKFEQPRCDPELLESLPEEARQLVRPGKHYSVVMARANRWTHPSDVIARAAERSSLQLLRLEIVTTLFSHRADWSPGTVHEALISPWPRPGPGTGIDTERLPSPGTAALFLVKHSSTRPEILYVGTAR